MIPSIPDHNNTRKPATEPGPITLTITVDAPQLLAFLAMLRPAVAPTTTVEAAPALLDKAQLARALRVSKGQIDRLTRAGMPHELVGDRRRFALDACRHWLAARGKSPVSAEPANDRVDVSGIARRAGLRAVVSR